MEDELQSMAMHVDRSTPWNVEVVSRPDGAFQIGLSHPYSLGFGLPWQGDGAALLRHIEQIPETDLLRDPPFRTDAKIVRGALMWERVLSKCDAPGLFIGLMRWLYELEVFDSIALDWLLEHEARMSIYLTRSDSDSFGAPPPADC